LIFSVALSLYLGLFVSIGVGIYWTYSNLLSIVQLFLLNILINPKKFIDYEALENSKEELKAAKQYVVAKSKVKRDKSEIQREKQDYKKFLAVSKMKIVFYSEKNGFYKYYRNIIEEIIRRTNIVIHYITSDPNDEVFGMESEQFKPYYIGENRLIVLMMKLQADVVVMTTPDLENFHLKRSYVKQDALYIYVPHDVNSSNLTFHKDALDHYDVIFTSGYKNKAELAEREEKFGVKKKQLVEWGSGVIDNMIESYNAMLQDEIEDVEKKTVLIAPSWQKDNIMDSYIDEMLDQLKNSPFQIIVRPHPQYVRHYAARIEALEEKYSSDNIIFEKDFSSNKTVYTADLLITDWSSIAFEYTFSTLKPVLFINTPMKVMNPEYQELQEVPIDIELRSEVGISLDTDKLAVINETVDTLLGSDRFSKESMAQLREKYIYNIGTSGKVGAKFIIDYLINKEKK
jgi:YidC/Oxa1 family membrane protein insertase